MSHYLDAKSKLQNIRSTLDLMSEGDFPPSAAERAFRRLRKVFEGLEKNLDRAHVAKSSDSVGQYADLISTKIYQSLPIMGFILRSTDIRNTFELLDPFQILANGVLDGLSQVLISAEWDYIPFAYPQNLEDLKGFVLIGMPGSEVDNALLIPLAGHELGHAVWRNKDLSGSVGATLQFHCSAIYESRKSEFEKLFTQYKAGDLHYRETYSEAQERSVEYASYQAEELFCDMFAYALFGESYVRAFAYMLAPGNGRGPNPKYPTYRTRIGALGEIASGEGVTLPSMADLGLANEGHRGNPQTRFIVNVAEQSVELIKRGLWKQASDIISKSKVRRPSQAESLRHLREIRLGIPAEAPVCLGDIINAGWMHYSHLQESMNSHEERVARTVGLNEILFKTIEVLEFNRKAKNGT